MERPSFPRISHGGYTKLVRALRVALPVTAALVLAGVLIWPRFDPAQAPKRHEEAKAPEMNHSHFSGIDKSNRPYTISADKAVQPTGGSNDVIMTRPVAEMTMENGSWVALKADHGQYREDPGRIDLQGNVQMFHDEGYQIGTSAAVIDLDKGVAWSDQPTKGHGPRGEIQGEGFRLIQDDDKIIFTGNSRLLIRAPEDDGAQDDGGDAAGESVSPRGAAK